MFSCGIVLIVKFVVSVKLVVEKTAALYDDENAKGKPHPNPFQGERGLGHPGCEQLQFQVVFYFPNCIQKIGELVFHYIKYNFGI